MLFSLEVLRACKGDCLILHFGATDPHIIMIDGGPSNVYQPHLKPRLELLREQRGLDEGQPLVVDALLVSHVDDDHIKGILELTKELRDAKSEQKPVPVRVRSLWHNSFDEILATTPEQLHGAAQFGAAALSGEVPIDDDLSFDVAQVLSSIPQGNQLRVDAQFLEWRVNHEFGGQLVMATGEPEVVVLDDSLKLTVIGPMRAELLELQKKHDEWLRTRAATAAGRAEETLAAYKDKSVPNLSSIVLLAEAGGRRMLLTGDARGDKIIEGLELTGRIPAGGSIHVDLLKVPHHGSAYNVETRFFERVTADHYVFSGNGEHGNPERETLEMVFDARGNSSFVMHFTYPIDEIDAGRKAEWIKQQAKKKPGQSARDWAPETDGLATLLAGRDLAGARQEIRIAGESGHVIDLLDPIEL